MKTLFCLTCVYLHQKQYSIRNNFGTLELGQPYHVIGFKNHSVGPTKTTANFFKSMHGNWDIWSCNTILHQLFKKLEQNKTTLGLISCGRMLQVEIQFSAVSCHAVEFSTVHFTYILRVGEGVYWFKLCFTFFQLSLERGWGGGGGGQI